MVWSFVLQIKGLFPKDPLRPDVNQFRGNLQVIAFSNEIAGEKTVDIQISTTFWISMT
jgi:hypothetical protein